MLFRSKDRNFDSYKIPRFSWLPKLDCVILDKKDQPPQGGGEPAIIAVGAAVGNAIFNATGARLFRVPFTPERVLEAIARSESFRSEGLKPESQDEGKRKKRPGRRERRNK